MSEELDKARKAYEQAKARFQKAQTIERTKERKADARRKIIIGSAMLSMIAAQSPKQRLNLVQHLFRYISKQDRPLVRSLLADLTRASTMGGE